MRVRLPPSAPRGNIGDPAPAEGTADSPPNGAFGNHLSNGVDDALEAALLVAARAGDVATVARLTELLHARRIDGSEVVSLDRARKREPG